MSLALVEAGKSIKNAAVLENKEKGWLVMLTEWKKEFEMLEMRLADLRVSL
jgi:hypothetical protein